MYFACGTIWLLSVIKIFADWIIKNIVEYNCMRENRITKRI